MDQNWIYRRGDVYLADLDPVMGSEQGGTRPVVVLQNDVGNYYSDTIIVVPLTGRMKRLDLPVHVYMEKIRGLSRPSVAETEQLVRISKDRVRNYLGRLTREQMKRVEKALLNSLGMPVPECGEAP